MWFWIAAFAVTLAAVYLLAPKPQSNPPPAVKDPEVPIAEEGVEIPVLFGTKWLKGPNVVWYGDLKTEAIKSKGGGKK